MATTEVQLRLSLGERIPEGGAESDTLFTSEEIADIIEQSSGVHAKAAYLGWVIKAGLFADQVNTAKGNATEELSDLHQHALDMVKMWGEAGGKTVTTRVHLIRR